MAVMDVRDVRAARADAAHRFAAWCIQAGGWWYWRWELSWIATMYFGAMQLEKPVVKHWVEPLLEAFIAGAWILYWTDDTLYWVAKPRVHKDPTPGTRRLHHDRYAAIESDVENLYFWRGVLVPAFVVVKPEWITAQHIVHEKNAQVRAAMVSRFVGGMAKLCRDLKAEVADRAFCANGPTEDPSRKYELLLLDLGDGRKRPYLYMRNPSTGEEHIEGVAPEIKTVREALHWYKPAALKQIPIAAEGAEWHQQGDVCIWPKGAKAVKEFPTILT